jgi:hypothetical protein
MQLKLAHILLYSAHRDQLAQFLSALFDVEIHVEHDAAFLDVATFRLKLVQSEGRITKKQAALTMIELSVDGDHELSRLAQKIEFLNYRSSDGEKNNHVEFELSKNHLSFVDMDQRQWIISCE